MYATNIPGKVSCGLKSNIIRFKHPWALTWETTENLIVAHCLATQVFIGNCWLPEGRWSRDRLRMKRSWANSMHNTLAWVLVLTTKFLECGMHANKQAIKIWTWKITTLTYFLKLPQLLCSLLLFIRGEKCMTSTTWWRFSKLGAGEGLSYTIGSRKRAHPPILAQFPARSKAYSNERPPWARFTGKVLDQGKQFWRQNNMARHDNINVAVS